MHNSKINKDSSFKNCRPVFWTETVAISESVFRKSLGSLTKLYQRKTSNPGPTALIYVLGVNNPWPVDCIPVGASDVFSTCWVS